MVTISLTSRPIRLYVFVPYFAPDEPASGTERASPKPIYYNDYLRNMSIPGRVAGHCYGTKEIGAAALILGHDNCQPTPIQPSHQPQRQDSDAINAMVVDGTAVTPEGLSCGWRDRSQGAPFTESAPYKARRRSRSSCHCGMLPTT